MKLQFFEVKTREQVWAEYHRFAPVGLEEIPLDRASNRVLGEPIVAVEDLPGFAKATVDGYAVRARDSFGASESQPALLAVVGDVGMGEVPPFEVGPGEAARIPTGGMLPAGADSVVMVEYTEELDGRSVAISRSVAPLENMIGRGDDVRAGKEVLAVGRRLRAQEIGLLAGLGRTKVMGSRRPRVAVVSSGDEIVPVDRAPGPAQLRDINSYSLAALVEECGGEPWRLGVIPDEFEALRAACEQALKEADICLISGGSSVGTRDLTLQVLGSFPDTEVLVHGVAISPGKPTILVRVGDRAFWGLPGHVASAMVVFHVLVRPFMDHRRGIAPSLGGRWPLRARLSRNVASRQGREDFIRVRLQQHGEGLLAEPVFGESGLISTLVRADGLVRIDRHTEGVYAGELVEILRI
ncbi:MAG: gephyrin-like molybdotransferase Glp [Nitrospirota bacterium]